MRVFLDKDSKRIEMEMRSMMQETANTPPTTVFTKEPMYYSEAVKLHDDLGAAIRELSTLLVEPVSPKPEFHALLDTGHSELQAMWREVQETFRALSVCMDNNLGELLYAKAMWTDISMLIAELKKMSRG